jgi:hypothetical protein
LISGALFYLASIYRVKALQTTPVSIVFALTNLDLVLSGAIALCIPTFGEPLTIWRILAVLVAGMAILLGTQIRMRLCASPYACSCRSPSGPASQL